MAPYRILVADDDSDWARIVAGLLKGGLYEVSWAATGEEALVLASTNPPDLALLDIRLPDMTGQELCVRLRELPGLERLPIVAFSAYRQEKVDSLNIGADAFVGKSAVETDLVPTLEALLRRVRMDLGVLVKGDLRLDPNSHSVYQEDQLVANLTRKEFLFFYALVKNGPKAVARDELMRQVSSTVADAGESRALDMLATRTKRRLGKALGARVRSSRNFGWCYLFEPGAGPDPSRRAQRRSP